MDGSDVAHAGAGTTLLLSYAGLIPGVLPTLAIAVVLGAVLLVPALVLGLVATVLVAPLYGLWRLIARVIRAG